MSDRNLDLFERAKQRIPGGVNSPVRAFRAVGGTPRFVQRAQGASFWDANGQKYIDYIGSWGPMILGHGHPAVLEAVQKAAMDGFSFGSVQVEGRFYVTFDGLQGTPGTGAIAIGDYVVCGTPAAKGTKLTAPAKVCKATAAGSALNFKWRVVSLGAAGTGAVGTTGLIELVC